MGLLQTTPKTTPQTSTTTTSTTPHITKLHTSQTLQHKTQYNQVNTRLQYSNPTDKAEHNYQNALSTGFLHLKISMSGLPSHHHNSGEDYTTTQQGTQITELVMQQSNQALAEKQDQGLLFPAGPPPEDPGYSMRNYLTVSSMGDPNAIFSWVATTSEGHGLGEYAPLLAQLGLTTGEETTEEGWNSVVWGITNLSSSTAPEP